MESLKQQAEEILSAKKHIIDAKKEKEDEKYNFKINFLKVEFEECFAAYLPLLKKEGIKWNPDLQNRRHTHHGSFIEFTKGDKSAKMDFHNRHSYRYEYVPNNSQGNSIYGKWDKEGFILFLYEGFKEDN